MPPNAQGAIRRHAPAPRRSPTQAALPGVELHLAGRDLVLRFGTPAPGGWNRSFTAEVAQLVARCRADARAARLVLTGARLFDDDNGDADLSPLLDAIAAPGIPVHAQMPGDAMGSGLELALTCHSRAAVPAARLGFPGIRAGRLPVIGGIARLARLVGPAAALEMLAFGTLVPAPLAERLGLTGAAVGRPSQPFDPRPLHSALGRRAPGEAAPQAALQALLHALTMPPQRAQAETRALAAALAASSQGEALRHATRAEAVPPHRDALARLRWSLLREAIHLVDEGATPQAVDLALRRFGFAVPPLVAADRDGLDEVASACVDPDPEAWCRYSPLLDLLIDAGRTGRAAGAGWYRYDPEDPRPRPDPALLPLLADSAAAACRRRAPIDAADIAARCLAALAGGAAGLIEQGHDRLAVDGLSLALGFPRWRGGIWHHVQATGPAAIAARLAAMPTAAPPPAPLREG
jgi:enoyl-CoA hydratase/carnithine racemase